jgi:hypothetical protein
MLASMTPDVSSTKLTTWAFRSLRFMSKTANTAVHRSFDCTKTLNTAASKFESATYLIKEEGKGSTNRNKGRK